MLLISRNDVPLKNKKLYLLNAQKQGIQTSQNFSNRVSVSSPKLHSMLFSVVFLWQCQRLTIKIVGIGTVVTCQNILDHVDFVLNLIDKKNGWFFIRLFL